MRVLLSVEHTIFQIEDDRDNYQQILNFITINFSSKNIKENIIYIPRSDDANNKRRFLMKWLYSYYKKSSKNFNPNLKLELMKRLDRPIHIQFPPRDATEIIISATFYEGGVCQLTLDGKNEKCELYLLQYFAGCIRLKSLTFNLYEVKISTNKHKRLLGEFFKKKTINDLKVVMQYSESAFEYFIDLIQERDAIDKACTVLKVKRDDSLQDIKKNYRKLAKRCHPDLSKLKEETSTKQFQLLCDAFDVIKKYKEVA